MKTIYTDFSNPCPSCFEPGSIILAIRTSTRFWRTSRLLRADLIMHSGNSLREIAMIAEKESDEYDILIELENCLRNAGLVYTFNGSSFTLPHLRKKYRAYGRTCSIDTIRHIDLYHEFRQYDSLLSLDSHKLSDYDSLLYPSAENTAVKERSILKRTEMSEARVILNIMPLMRLSSLKEGKFIVTGSYFNEEEQNLVFEIRCDLPCEISFKNEYFIIEGKAETVRITVKLDHGKLRVYYRDYKNYVFLPLEGYSVHKSVAAYIAASRKIPATRENCYTYIPFTKDFLENKEKITAYLKGIFNL